MSLNFKTPISFDPDRLPTTWCYIRVSTWAQDLLKERYTLEKFAKEHDMPQVTFLEDQVSGKIPWRERKLGVIIKECKKGDILLVHEISRISRKMTDILDFMAEMADREIPIYTVKDAQRYGKDMNSKILAMVMAMAADIERELIMTRTADALAARKAKNEREGKKANVGRSKLDDYKQTILDQLVRDVPKSKVCDSLPCKCSVSNLNTWLNKRDLNKTIQEGIKERVMVQAAKAEMIGRLPKPG